MRRLTSHRSSDRAGETIATGSKVGSELLFDVISTAYERTGLIVTTSLPFESWTEVLGSERITVRHSEEASPPRSVMAVMPVGKKVTPITIRPNDPRGIGFDATGRNG